jgi:glycyl-tRNA synthetase beta chain
MDPDFLDLPPEVIQLTMKTHQKYFAVEDKAGKIAPKFVVIANQDAPDGGKAIAAGNARVLSARLSDARHFWDLDRAKGLEAMAKELNKVTFHEKLGTVADKAERVAALAKRRSPRRWAPIRSSPSSPRNSPRPTSSARWSTSSPSFRA